MFKYRLSLFIPMPFKSRYYREDRQFVEGKWWTWGNKVFLLREKVMF